MVRPRLYALVPKWMRELFAMSFPATGIERYKEYVNNRLVDGKESFFSPIKKLKLHTGIQKPKKTPKAVSILKEDRQAFGILVGKAASIEEAFAYPITTIPLSLATPGGELRQGDKAALRNFMIKESNSDVKTPPENARWIIDGMALFRSIKPKETYSTWFKSAIRCANPPRDAKAISREQHKSKHTAEERRVIKAGAYRKCRAKDAPR